MHPTTLHLQVSCKGETLQVLVADDGPGFSTTNLSPGTGLTNLRTRLEHIYGANAQLSIMQGERRGVEVLVTLPLFPPDYGRTLPDRNQNRGAAPSLHD
jgi:signal transduction histidine kinase